MAACERCNNTGKLSAEMYCNCVDGQMQKRLDRSKRAAERKKAEEQKEVEAAKAKKAKQLELLEEEKPSKKGITIHAPCKLFDWIIVTRGEHTGVIGVVEKMDDKDRQAFVAAYKHEKGHKVTGKSWFDWSIVKALPPSKDEDDLLALVDLSLQTKDEDWFMELTARLPKGRVEDAIG